VHSGFTLEASERLGNALWSAILPGPTLLNNEYSVQVSKPEAQLFFRLRRP
jgi:hypothetical protein